MSKSVDPMKVLLDIMMEKGYVNKDNGAPIKCYHCDSKNLGEGKVYYGEISMEECETVCNDCNTSLGWWTYGIWDPVIVEV
jgi:hypothetical protein